MRIPRKIRDYKKTPKSGMPQLPKNYLKTHPNRFLRMIEVARRCDKAKNAFVEGLLSFVHNGRIHADINQIRSDQGGTVTGRFSMSNPNLQQIPAKGYYGKKIREFSAEATRVLLDYPWPGNVRELENSIEHAVLLARGGKIEASDLPAIFHTPTTIANADQLRTLAEHEREFLQKALEKCGWNKKLTAQRLKISRNTLYMKLKKYQIISPTLQ